jgi:hypothetical protein
MSNRRVKDIAYDDDDLDDYDDEYDEAGDGEGMRSCLGMAFQDILTFCHRT